MHMLSSVVTKRPTRSWGYASFSTQSSSEEVGIDYSAHAYERHLIDDHHRQQQQGTGDRQRRGRVEATAGSPPEAKEGVTHTGASSFLPPTRHFLNKLAAHCILLRLSRPGGTSLEGALLQIRRRLIF